MRSLLSVLLIFGAIACRREPAVPSKPGPVLSVSSAAQSSESPATQALDRLDGRTPVPLLPMMADHQKQNMREHLVAVQEIVAAAGVSDFPAIEKSARRIGYSEQMGRMCSHMGAAAPGFTERALAFHHTADTIANAARRRDLSAVLRALGETLSSCTGCHATFKQRVVAELPKPIHQGLASDRAK